MKFVLILLLSIFFFAGRSTVVDASTPATKTEDRPSEKQFHAVSVSTGIELWLTQGNEQKITAEGRPEDLKDLRTEIRGGQLRIYEERHSGWLSRKSVKSSRIRVYVSFNKLDEIQASAGSTVLSNTAFQLDSVMITVSSGANLKLDQFRAQVVAIGVSSGANAMLSGTVDHLKATTSSGSNLRCGDLKAKVVEVHAGSGSDAVVQALDKLDAYAASGSGIKYYGNPKQRNTSSSSGGNIHAR